MSPILGIIASQNYPRITNNYESIATTTVGAGGAADITFSSIPGTYKHLQIRGIGRNNSTATNDLEGLQIQYNADTGSNYSWHYLLGNGSTASSSATANATVCYTGYTPSNGSTSNTFGAFVIDILDYANTNKYKTQRALTGIEPNTTANDAIGLWSGSWRNTNAITSIKIFNTSSRDFIQYTQFALYGIKA